MAATPPPSCSVTQGGKTWDLSSLASTTDYNYTSPISASSFYLNLCQPVKSELYKIPSSSIDTLAAFLRTSKGDISLGSTSYNLTLTNTSYPTPQIILGEGADCPSGGKRTSLIDFVCSPTAAGQGGGLGARGGPELMASLPAGVGEEERCTFVWEWRTSAACPRPAAGAGHLSDWGSVGVLVAMAIAVFFAWFLGVVLYNRFILHLRGTAQLPSIPSLPSISLPSIPNLFRRKQGVGSGWGRGGGAPGGYGRVSTIGGGGDGGASDEEEGLVGRFGLDSDDDEEDARALSGDPRVWRSDDGFPKPAAPSDGGSGGLINLG